MTEKQQLPGLKQEVHQVPEKASSFIVTTHSEVDLFHSKPQCKIDRKKCLLQEKAEPGIDLEIQGAKSWWDYCKKYPKKNPYDVWVLAKIVTPNHKLFGRLTYITRGDVTRIKEQMRQENQPKQRKLTRKAALGRAAEYQTKPLQTDEPIHDITPITPQQESETTDTFEQVFPAGTRLFLEKPRAKLPKEKREERTKFLNETADWTIQDRVTLKIKGIREEIESGDDNWCCGEVVTVGKKDAFPSLDGKDTKQLRLGQMVYVNIFERFKKAAKKG